MNDEDIAAPAPPATPVPVRRRGPRGKVWSAALGLMLLVMLVIASGAGLWWAVRSEAGSAWVVSRLPGVEVTAPRGVLLGDFETGRVVVKLSGNDQIVFTGLGWRGLQLARSEASGQWARLSMDDLHALRIDLLLTPSNDPMTAPTRLHLPVQVNIERLQIGAVYGSGLGDNPLRDVLARVQLGAADGDAHRIDALSAVWERLKARGAASIATRSPFALDLKLDVSQVQGAPPAQGLAAPGSAAPATALAQPSIDLAAWQASVALAGPLEAPTLNASVQAPATSTHPAQTLTAQAGLRPFAAWPLADLQVQTRALDLSALSRSAPVTALTGRVTVQSTAFDRPIAAQIALSNDAAGRWNDGFAPLRHLKADLSARADDPSTVDLKTFDVEFGTQAQAGGSLSGSGRWHTDRSTLSATLHALQPSVLDARAPAMLIGGPLLVALTPTGATAVAAASSPAAEAAGGGAQIELKFDLTGTLSPSVGSDQVDTAGKTVQIKLDALADAQHLTLRELRASAGGALATLTGDARRPSTTEPWQAKGRATLVEFDPLPWWPGRTDSPWRRGTNRLNAKGDFDLTLPPELSASWTGWRGNAQLAMVHSLVAGTPVDGSASLRSLDSGYAEAALALQVADNRLQAQGRFETTARANATSGSTDHWTVSLDAPALAGFEPLWRLVQAPGADARLAGTLKAAATIDGRWPAIATQGELSANGLRVGAVVVQQASANWNAGTATGTAVAIDANLSQMRLLSAPPASSKPTASSVATASTSSSPQANASPNIESAQLKVSGTVGDHSLELRAVSKALPPYWTDTVQAAAGQAAPAITGADAAARSTLLLQAKGGFIDLPGQRVAGWRGGVQRLELRASSGNAAPWVRAGNIDIDAAWSAEPARVTVQPGQAEVLGAAVRWSQLAWQAAGGIARPARIDAQLAFDPLPISPLLARLQPGFGWGGDLTMGGRFNVQTDGGLTAELVLERSRGDLTVTDEISTQSLGLTNLRLAVSAKDGVWTFSQYLNGKTLGVLAGAVVVRTSPEVLWPTPDASIEGAAELDVANLSAWGTWVPTGWRLGGQMKTSALFAGRFGAPEVTGRIEGSALSARNFLEGVNISEGEVLISLQGNGARIERFNAKGGTGSLSIEGSAALGESPNAQLRLKADRFVLLGRVDRRIVTSGSAQLGFGRNTLNVDGGFTIDEGLIDFTRSDAPTLSDDVQVVRAAASGATRGAPADSAQSGSTEAATPFPTSTTSRNVALDLQIGLGTKLRLRGRGIETGLRGDLRLTAPGGRLAINGTITAARGTYAAYGQKLTIDRGQITFNGPPENPQLNIEATRPNVDIRVGVQITGTAQNPRIRLFSEPEVSEVDKLSWLALGRASDGLGGADTALLQTAAVALLAGEGDGITDQFTKAIGLDEMTLKQNQGEVRETVISLGKQLSRRWYVGYERGLNATAGSFQLVYRIARSFTLRAQSGFENSLDVIWTWRWG